MSPVGVAGCSRLCCDVNDLQLQVLFLFLVLLRLYRIPRKEKQPISPSLFPYNVPKEFLGNRSGVIDARDEGSSSSLRRRRRNDQDVRGQSDGAGCWRRDGVEAGERRD